MEFAKQEYYDEIIKLFVASGLTFLCQVKITTDDCEYMLETERAENTQLVFFTEGLNCIVRLAHHERHKERQYWSLHVDMDFGNAQNREAAKQLTIMTGDVREGGYTPFQPRFPSFTHCGWSSVEQYVHRWNMEQWAWGVNHQLYPAVDLIGDVMLVIHQVKPFLAASPFESLSVMWEPTYTFSGRQNQDYNAHESAKAKCRFIYWERVGEARAVLATLIKRLPN